MLKGARSLHLDVCDYENNVVCSLYDNHSDASGQATDVFVNTERNGWKELTFKIPSTCMTEEGIEENYRLKYLIADYRLRLKITPKEGDEKTDYYLISEPRIVHTGKSKNVDVTAGHISQLLKTKNLNLEFSDEEGNNVGTAYELLQTILDGTGWTVGDVHEFTEDDGSGKTKVRSLVASAKTGAFALISALCEKFDAKPIYNGDTRTVDIVPLNPFAEVEGSEVPQEVLEGKTAIELNYGKNVTGMTRTLNTENLVTRLYAYGSYGDKTNGLCSLQTIEHTEYHMIVLSTTSENIEYVFTDKNRNRHYFTVPASTFGDDLIWSDMDPVSCSYVWNDTQKIIYKTYSQQKTTSPIELVPIQTTVANRFDYLMDFDYYEKIGLLTDAMLLELAKFQRNMPSKVVEATEATTNFLNSQFELSQIAESNTGFLKLNVDSYNKTAGSPLVLNIRKTEKYPDGIIYRSDYDEARRNYFSWYCAEGLKKNGDALYDIGSVVYIIHNDTNPITWEKAYVKEIDHAVQTMDYSKRDAKDPDSITLWIDGDKVANWSSTDRFYLFASNSISGRMGARESEIESLQQTLEQKIKVATEIHPTYFIWHGDPVPSVDVAKTSYGWYYEAYKDSTDFGKLYFCYGFAGEESWHRAYFSETAPTSGVSNGDYFFNVKSKVLFHRENNTWVNIAESGIIVEEDDRGYIAPNTISKRLAQSFSTVAYYCRRWDMLYKGLYDEYVYTATSKLPVGNYAIDSGYSYFWAFTTDQEIAANKPLKLNTLKYYVYQNEDVGSIVPIETKPYEAVDFPAENELAGVTLWEGTIDTATGVEANSSSDKRTGSISVYGNVGYSYKNMPTNTAALFYDSYRQFLSAQTLTASSSQKSLTTPARAKYVRFVFKTQPTNASFYVTDYSKKFFVKEVQYTILSNVTPQQIDNNPRNGMVNLVKAFEDTADLSYGTYLPAYKEAQQIVKDADDALKSTLKDLYREGYWQKNEYVEGDEDKLYKDALDNLKKISKPEATYDIQFLDLYSANQGVGYSVTEDLDSVEWPDIDISDAIHLVDEDIDVNCWAFIDRVEKCYDQPWKTRLSINTNLSLIGQHSFTDVLTRIADVANETNANQTIYKRAAAITAAGTYAADKLEGTIKANKLLVQGGTSNWYTDPKGNLVFESADGQSAMMLTGYGYCIANAKDVDGDWIFRTWGTGDGFTADEIVAGEMSAKHLIAGTITTDLLHASVGQELEIGSNKALMLYATTDGLRPAGGLKTQVTKAGDSFIEIAATDGTNPAYINVNTGGTLNLAGSQMNITSNGALNVTSGTIDVKSNGAIKIESGAKFTITSTNFNIDNSGNVSMTGTLTAKEGSKIGGWYIGTDRIMSGNGAQTGSTGMSSKTGANDITFWAGSSDPSNAKFRVTAGGVLNATDATITGNIEATTGTIGGWTVDSTMLKSSDSKIGLSSTGSSNIVFWAGGAAASAPFRVSNAGAMTSTSGNIGGWKIGTNSLYSGSGTTYVALNTDKNSDYAIWAGHGTASSAPFSVQRSGTLRATSATVDGTLYAGANSRIGATKNSSGAYTGGWIVANNTIKSSNGKVGLLSSTTTNDVAIWAGNATTGSAPFRVTTGGVLYATGATIGGTLTAGAGSTIGGWYIGADSIHSGSASATGKTGMASGKTTGTVTFWAGSATPAEAPFHVTYGGVLTATSAKIDGTLYAGANSRIGATRNDDNSYTGGWIIGSNKMYSGMTSLGDTTNNGVYLGTDGIALGKGAFKVTNAGALTATSATVRGTLKAGANSVIGIKSDGSGGWTVTDNKIYSGTNADSNYVALSSDTGSDYAIWAGKSTASSSPFYVKRNGTLYAKGATIDGVLTAGANSKIGVDSSGNGGWTVTANTISSGTSASYVALSSNTSASTNYSIWAGNSAGKDAPFSVKRDGTLKATNAEVTGTIKASALYIKNGDNYVKSKLTVDANGYIALGSFAANSGIYKAASLEFDGSRVKLTSIQSGSALSTLAGKKDKLVAVSDITMDGGKITLESLTQSAQNAINTAAKITINATDASINLSTVKKNADDAYKTEAALNTAISNLSLAPKGVTISTTGTFSVTSNNFTVNSNTGAVTISGALHAGTNSTIGATRNADGTYTGGWTITSNTIHSGSSTSYVALSSNTSAATNYSIWAGNATASKAPFSVKRDGTLTATSGSIGGWTLESNFLHSGKDTGYVALNADTTGTNKDWAIWAGAATPASAKFRVKRNGELYATKIVSEDKTTSQSTDVNLNDNGWKLNYQVITNYDEYNNQIKLSNGKIINFNRASSIAHHWNGGAFYGKIIDKNEQVIVRDALLASIGFNYTAAQLSDVLAGSSKHSTTLRVYDRNTGDDESGQDNPLSIVVDASEVYSAGKNSVTARLVGNSTLPSDISSSYNASAGYYYYGVTSGRSSNVKSSSAVYVRKAEDLVSRCYISSATVTNVTGPKQPSGLYNVTMTITIKVEFSDGSKAKEYTYNKSFIDVP